MSRGKPILLSGRAIRRILCQVSKEVHSNQQGLKEERGRQTKDLHSLPEMGGSEDKQFTISCLSEFRG
jgi:hypothetical protein